MMKFFRLNRFSKIENSNNSRAARARMGRSMPGEAAAMTSVRLGGFSF